MEPRHNKKSVKKDKAHRALLEVIKRKELAAEHKQDDKPIPDAIADYLEERKETWGKQEYKDAADAVYHQKRMQLLEGAIQRLKEMPHYSKGILEVLYRNLGKIKPPPSDQQLSSETAEQSKKLREILRELKPSSIQECLKRISQDIKAAQHPDPVAFDHAIGLKIQSYLQEVCAEWQNADYQDAEANAYNQGRIQVVQGVITALQQNPSDLSRIVGGLHQSFKDLNNNVPIELRWETNDVNLQLYFISKQCTQKKAELVKAAQEKRETLFKAAPIAIHYQNITEQKQAANLQSHLLPCLEALEVEWTLLLNMNPNDAGQKTRLESVQHAIQRLKENTLRLDDVWDIFNSLENELQPLPDQNTQAVFKQLVELRNNGIMPVLYQAWSLGSLEQVDDRWIDEATMSSPLFLSRYIEHLISQDADISPEDKQRVIGALHARIYDDPSYSVEDNLTYIHNQLSTLDRYHQLLVKHTQALTSDIKNKIENDRVPTDTLMPKVATYHQGTNQSEFAKRMAEGDQEIATHVATNVARYLNSLTVTWDVDPAVVRNDYARDRVSAVNRARFALRDLDPKTLSRVNQLLETLEGDLQNIPVPPSTLLNRAQRRAEIDYQVRTQASLVTEIKGIRDSYVAPLKDSMEQERQNGPEYVRKYKLISPEIEKKKEQKDGITDIAHSIKDYLVALEPVWNSGEFKDDADKAYLLARQEVLQDAIDQLDEKDGTPQHAQGIIQELKNRILFIDKNPTDPKLLAEKAEILGHLDGILKAFRKNLQQKYEAFAREIKQSNTEPLRSQLQEFPNAVTDKVISYLETLKREWENARHSEGPNEQFHNESRVKRVTDAIAALKLPNANPYDITVALGRSLSIAELMERESQSPVSEALLLDTKNSIAALSTISTECAKLNSIVRTNKRERAYDTAKDNTQDIPKVIDAAHAEKIQTQMHAYLVALEQELALSFNEGNRVGYSPDRISYSNECLAEVRHAVNALQNPPNNLTTQEVCFEFSKLRIELGKKVDNFRHLQTNRQLPAVGEEKQDINNFFKQIDTITYQLRDLRQTGIAPSAYQAWRDNGELSDGAVNNQAFLGLYIAQRIELEVPNSHAQQDVIAKLRNADNYNPNDEGANRAFIAKELEQLPAPGLYQKLLVTHQCSLTRDIEAKIKADDYPKRLLDQPLLADEKSTFRTQREAVDRVVAQHAAQNMVAYLQSIHAEWKALESINTLKDTSATYDRGRQVYLLEAISALEAPPTHISEVDNILQSLHRNLREKATAISPPYVQQTKEAISAIARIHQTYVTPLNKVERTYQATLKKIDDNIKANRGTFTENTVICEDIKKYLLMLQAEWGKIPDSTPANDAYRDERQARLEAAINELETTVYPHPQGIVFKLIKGLENLEKKIDLSLQNDGDNTLYLETQDACKQLQGIVYQCGQDDVESALDAVIGKIEDRKTNNSDADLQKFTRDVAHAVEDALICLQSKWENTRCVLQEEQKHNQDRIATLKQIIGKLRTGEYALDSDLSDLFGELLALQPQGDDLAALPSETFYRSEQLREISERFTPVYKQVKLRASAQATQNVLNGAIDASRKPIPPEQNQATQHIRSIVLPYLDALYQEFKLAEKTENFCSEERRTRAAETGALLERTMKELQRPNVTIQEMYAAFRALERGVGKQVTVVNAGYQVLENNNNRKAEAEELGAELDAFSKAQNNLKGMRQHGIEPTLYHTWLSHSLPQPAASEPDADEVKQIVVGKAEFLSRYIYQLMAQETRKDAKFQAAMAALRNHDYHSLNVTQPPMSPAEKEQENLKHIRETLSQLKNADQYLPLLVDHARALARDARAGITQAEPESFLEEGFAPPQPDEKLEDPVEFFKEQTVETNKKVAHHVSDAMVTYLKSVQVEWKTLESISEPPKDFADKRKAAMDKAIADLENNPQSVAEIEKTLTTLLEELNELAPEPSEPTWRDKFPSLYGTVAKTHEEYQQQTRDAIEGIESAFEQHVRPYQERLQEAKAADEAYEEKVKKHEADQKKIAPIRDVLLDTADDAKQEYKGTSTILASLRGALVENTPLLRKHLVTGHTRFAADAKIDDQEVVLPEWKQEDLASIPKIRGKKPELESKVPNCTGLPSGTCRRYTKNSNVCIQESNRDNYVQVSVEKPPTGYTKPNPGETHPADIDIAEAMVRLWVARCGNTSEVPIPISDMDNESRMRALIIVCMTHNLQFRLPIKSRYGYDFVTDQTVLRTDPQYKAYQEKCTDNAVPQITMLSRATMAKIHQEENNLVESKKYYDAHTSKNPDLSPEQKAHFDQQYQSLFDLISEAKAGKVNLSALNTAIETLSQNLTELDAIQPPTHARQLRS